MGFWRPPAAQMPSEKPLLGLNNFWGTPDFHFCGGNDDFFGGNANIGKPQEKM